MNRLEGIILDEAYRGVPVKDGKRQVTIPMARAVVRSLAVNAAKGSQRAQRLFTTLIQRDGARPAEDARERARGGYRLQGRWERELERRKRLGIVAANPLPHPDDIVVDIGDGTVVIKGPATKEGKVLWEIWTEQQITFKRDLRELEAYLEDPDATEREEAMKDVVKLTECLKIIDLALNGSRPALRLLKQVTDDHFPMKSARPRTSPNQQLADQNPDVWFMP